MHRLPRSYLGVQHRVIGTDLLAIQTVLHAPEQALGKDLAAQLHEVRAEGWYPVALLVEVLEALDRKLGAYAVQSAGWEIFKLSHGETVRATASTAKDILQGLDGMYHRSNRGTAIGGWRVLSFEAGRAELEKTSPHHCLMDEGFVHEALRSVGVGAEVSQTRCFRRGADSCVFVVVPSKPNEPWGTH